MGAERTATLTSDLGWGLVNIVRQCVGKRVLWLQVLTYKKAGEECVKTSGIPYTIVRPGRLTEGPYTGKGVVALTCGIGNIPAHVSMIQYHAQMLCHCMCRF